MKSLRCRLVVASSLALGALLCAPRLDAAEPSAGGGAKPLRVCADGDYMPYSNRAGQGFENKVAAFVAQALRRRLDYHWASYRGPGGFSNFLAENLDVGKCDMVMNLPYGDPEEDYTQPYYVSSYVFVTKKSAPYDITSLTSPALRNLKIGIETGTPPETALKILGLTGNAVPFDIAGNPSASPKSLLQAVQDGRVGVLITWQPAIGYFLRDYPDLKTTPLHSEQFVPGIPAERFSFAMAMGVRPHDDALKQALDKVIAANKAQIADILAAYDVSVRPGAAQAVNFPDQ